MPTREVIKPQVIEKIAVVMHVDKDSINEENKLKEDLGMGSLILKAMSVPYTKISLQYPNGKIITQKAAGELTTVKESIDLVYKQSDGSKDEKANQ